MDNIRITFKDRKHLALCITDIRSVEYNDGIMSFITKDSETRRDYMIPLDSVLHAVITEEL